MADKYYKYRTRSGDTYDMLALAFYNEERLASKIVQSNPRYSGVVVFEAGVLLKIPVLDNSNTAAPETVAPWRR